MVEGGGSARRSAPRPGIGCLPVIVPPRAGSGWMVVAQDPHGSISPVDRPVMMMVTMTGVLMWYGDGSARNMPDVFFGQFLAIFGDDFCDRVNINKIC
jgi:hypothetical protein